MKLATRKSPVPLLKDKIRKCIICGSEYEAVSYLQKVCSDECRFTKNKALIEKFHFQNPNVREKYNKTQNERFPNRWRDKRLKERLKIIHALGGECVVCGHSNVNHLCIDYAPTMIGTGYRHPVHPKWIIDHIKDFRLLCANHHQELSTTGKIEGTTITQMRALTPKKYVA